MPCFATAIGSPTKLKALPPLGETAPSLATALPGLVKPLSHAWIDDDLVAEKAVKGDSADVPVHLWDQRINLVLETASFPLQLIRRVMFGWVCRRVAQSFLQHMKCCHAQEWASWWATREGKLSLANQGGAGNLKLESPCQKNCFNSCHGGKMTPSKQRWIDKTNQWLDIDPSPKAAFLLELEAGTKAIAQFCDSSWWKWDRGSALLFWRWPTTVSCHAALHGFPWWVQGDLPSHKRTQKRMPADVAAKVASKLGNSCSKDFISPCWSEVKSDVDSFAVPKGDDDVRMVFNGTSSGLNDAVWAPNFWLPTPSTALRQLSFGSFSVDLDLGEMFLNFPLPRNMQPFAGVRMEQVAPIINDSKACPRLVQPTECWTRLLMGAKPSPFMAIRHFLHAEEFVVGDPKEPGSPMRWDRIILNLPGMENFDPRLPWVMKWDDERGCIAGVVVTFVDDGRGSGKDPEHAWQVAMRFASRLQHLGGNLLRELCTLGRKLPSMQRELVRKLLFFKQ